MTKKTVLFVDDERNILDGLKRLLRPMRKSWNILFAVGGREALEVLESTKVDAIVTDMRMPEIDGANLLSQIADEKPGMVRLILSGQSHKSKLLNIVSTAHQFLSKPCNSDLLIETINRSVPEDNEQTSRHWPASVRTLPTMPQKFDEFEAILVSEEPTVSALYQVVRSDIGMAAKVMQLANSNFFGSPLERQSLLGACERLGVDLFRELFGSSRAFRRLNEDDPKLHTFLQLNRRAMERLESREASTGRQSDIEELGELFAEIGTVVVFENLNSDDEPMLAELDSKYIRQIGSDFLQMWGFSDEVVAIVSRRATSFANEKFEDPFEPIAVK